MAKIDPMESLHDMLLRRLEHLGVARTITAAIICETANRVLPPEGRATSFRLGRLTVAFGQPAEAYFFKETLADHLDRVNAALPKPVVETIYVRVDPNITKSSIGS